ncbi:glycosyltransferase family 39 protein [Actomonas aquatica]|uniref:Glycosyltransferase family 39 protein n=1 Tax=Actomonas aquatica TaxID=2866162 RepID=A0ABZ1C9Z3_9BACT|nr:glycosyltransferase family 39 protein [Opitutus sp. WL0086]WRQ88291.1 glycosyltransferase family 39 protein [Opitutus sp. WL0086]
MPLLERLAADPRRCWAVVGAMALIPLVIGFGLFTPDALRAKLFDFGYGIMTVSVLLLAVALIRLLVRARASIRSRLVGLLTTLLAVGAVWLWVISGDEPGYKVLMDEPALQATALHLQETRQVGTTALAFYHGNDLRTQVRFLDKRPYAYAFVLSVLHDVVGYAESNAFVLNRLALALFLLCTYLLAVRAAGLMAGLVALALLCTLPLLSQTANSAGMEMFNLALLSLTALLAGRWLERPSSARLDALCFATVLLAQSRYESAAYVVAVGLVILLAWIRARRPILSWGLLLTPWLLIPSAWLHRFVAAQPVLWELQEGQTSRFDPAFFSSNLRGAWNYLSNLSPDLPNSPAIFGVGVLAVLVLAVWWFRPAGRSTFWQALRSGQPLAPRASFAVVLLGFGLIVGLNLLLLQFYYWARLDDYLACRFSLPFMWWLVLAAVGALALHGRRSGRGGRVVPLAIAMLAVVGPTLGLHTLPARAERVYTVSNLVTQEIDWERNAAAALAVPRHQLLVLSNKSALPWILQGVPALEQPLSPQQWAELHTNVSAGAVPFLLLSQRLTRASADATWTVNDGDRPPAGWEVRVLGETIIGQRLIRLVQLIPQPTDSASL